jgi:hypothetical protein
MACARGMEAVLVAAALDPNVATGVGHTATAGAAHS